MHDILPLINHKSHLSSSSSAFIDENKFSFSKKVRESREPVAYFDVHVFELLKNYEEEAVIFSVDGEVLISSTIIDYYIPEELSNITYQRLLNLPENEFEIRTQDHIVTIEKNFVDQWGEPTILINELEKRLNVVRPSFNNNKVFSNRDDHFSLENLHVDSFYEKRTDIAGKRFKMWRYFLNLSPENRQCVIGLHHPGMVDVYLGKDYQVDHLGDFIQATNYQLPAILLNIQGRKQNRIYVYKILATHLLHAPYNRKKDFMAIINTLE